MRVISNYKPFGEQDLPNKHKSKSFVTKAYARAVKKLERTNRKVSR